MTQNFINQSGWLSFNSSSPRLYITSEDVEFDLSVLEAWKKEGFMVEYLPMGNGGRAYREKLESLGRGLGVGEKYAIIAFGAAASFCLEAHLSPHAWSSRLCSLVAYYPTTVPAPTTKFPSHMRVLVHLPSGTGDTPDTIGVTRPSEILGIQGKRKTVQKAVTPGAGSGGLQLHMSYRCYTYTGVDVGFAERDLDEYDGVADGTAFTRSLSTIRRAFGAEVELERQWEESFDATWQKPNLAKSLSAFCTEPEPYVVHAPTLTGGVGADDMRCFYEDYFVPCDVDEKAEIGLEVLLLSRTIGTDSVVDELHVRFTHKVVMPWILPEVAPTGRDVDVIIVCIVTLRAGKIWCERMYWDQASVLVQVGLLNPNNVPPALKKKGVKRLPVTGEQSASIILDIMCRGEAPRKEGEVYQVNDIIKDWKTGTKMLRRAAPVENGKPQSNK
ncbi:hypothetical protein EJ05DRAFT_477241 [Pseudovirgaria hyperparasitica]|uniref:Dienelactone hydrolase n=1 Tax=Pseudovirgaria hyperparasitica TaxID=470096 RepID=A0A6A6W640_9PEZI|nr:uncharacterized protein EJ05DRAFT_477241 [Pseudovirgaria hyperparasitica]KAF2757017.1 hypothetical protein EJ05DRAFT_477241 [Pseudovirgaria hyperparasitica]